MRQKPSWWLWGSRDSEISIDVQQPAFMFLIESSCESSRFHRPLVTMQKDANLSIQTCLGNLRMPKDDGGPRTDKDLNP